MSAKKHFFLFALSVFVAFLFFSSITNEASPNFQQMATKDKIPTIEKINAGPGVKDPVSKKEKLAKKIDKDYADLKRIFEEREGNFGQKMAKTLGKKAIIVVGDEVYYGKRKIREFWEEMRETYESVEFNLEWAFIVFEEHVPEEMEDYDLIAYEYFKFHLLDLGEGEILKNQDGEGERSGRHTQGCEWIGR